MCSICCCNGSGSRNNLSSRKPRNIFAALPRRSTSLDEWRQYGGLETLLSYGLKPSINPDRRRTDQACDRICGQSFRAEHLDFLQSLELTFSCGDFLFVHAGVRPGVPIHEQTEDDLLWIRDDFLNWQQPFERFVVHGHTPMNEPDLRPNRINIDTGAYATGRLTCVVIENAAIRLLADEASSWTDPSAFLKRVLRLILQGLDADRTARFSDGVLMKTSTGMPGTTLDDPSFASSSGFSRTRAV